METRSCTACHKDFPLEEFPQFYDKKNKTHRRRGVCPACKNAWQKDYAARRRRGEVPAKTRNSPAMTQGDFDTVLADKKPILLRDNVVRGLSFRVYPAGTGAWVAHAESSVPRVIAKGSIPLDDARVIARKYFRNSGLNPVGEREGDQMRRKFIAKTEFIDGKPHGRKVIQCSSCGNKDSFNNDLSDNAVQSRFRGQGWSVGHSPSKDLCPSCAKGKTEPAPPVWCNANESAHDEPMEQTEEQTTMMLDPVPDFTPPAPAEPVEDVVESPPAQTEEDRRLDYSRMEDRKPTRAEISKICAAISADYPQVDKGYVNGASDQTISNRLCVPERWVADERERAFGPQEYVDFNRIMAELATARFDLTVARDLQDSLEVRIRKQRGNIDEIGSRISKLEADLKAAIDLSLGV